MKNSSRNCNIEVWHAHASREAPGSTEAICESFLPNHERSNADRFRQATSRNQHVIGRGMARRLLGGDAVPPKDICFGHGEYGKPHVESPAGAQQPFNVAHTDGLVLCAVGDPNAVEFIGIDVESLDRRASTEGLAERFFAATEVSWLRRQPTSEQPTLFLRIWTLKESYIKAIGTGLQTPLADFAFHDIESDEPKIEFLVPRLVDERPWSFSCFEPRPGFVAASAVSQREGYVAQIRCRRFEELLHDNGESD